MYQAISSVEYTGAAHSRNSSANNEHVRGCSSTTNDRPELEDCEEAEKGPLKMKVSQRGLEAATVAFVAYFHVKLPIDLPGERLQGTAIQSCQRSTLVGARIVCVAGLHVGKRRRLTFLTGRQRRTIQHPREHENPM